MKVRFTKMHGCGNDFVVFDERQAPLGLTPALAAAIADRRTGIGCDQLISIEPTAPSADVFMRIRNPDGSEAGACGNATRCVVDLLSGQSGGEEFTIRTIAGDLLSRCLPDGRIRVDMGPPQLGWAEIPLSHEMDTLHLLLNADGLSDPAACSMGNPHVTFFVPDIAAVPIAAIGAQLEHREEFPDRANIGFVEIRTPDRIRLRVWERGAGLTLACGSGACAALVNAHRRGLANRRADIILDGGILEIEWRPDNHVWMTGPAATTFTGEIDLARFPA